MQALQTTGTKRIPSFRLVITTALLFLALPLSTRAADISVPGGTISLEAPVGFTQLTSDEKEQISPDLSSLATVFMSPGQPSMVSVTLEEMPLDPATPERLPALLDYIVTKIESILPGFKSWNKSVLSLNGKQWLRIDTSAVNGNNVIRTGIFITDLNGSLVTVHMVGIEEGDEAFEQVFGKTIQSLSVIAEPGVETLPPLDSNYDQQDIDDLIVTFGWDLEKGYGRSMEELWGLYFAPYIENAVFANAIEIQSFLESHQITDVELLALLHQNNGFDELRNYVLEAFKERHQKEIVSLAETLIKARLTSEQIKQYLNLGEGTENIKPVEREFSVLMADSMKPNVINGFLLDYFNTLEFND